MSDHQFRRSGASRQQQPTQQQIHFEISTSEVQGSRHHGGDRAPLCFSFVCDNSGSMFGDKVDQVKQAVRELRSNVLHDRDYVEFVTFGTTVNRIHSMIRASKLDLERDLAQLDTNGGSTALYDAIGDSLENMSRDHSRQRRDLQKEMIVLTDGENNSSLRWTLDSLRSKLAKPGIANMHFYLIGVKIEATYEKQLASLCTPHHCKYLPVTQIDELSVAFRKIGQEIANRRQTLSITLTRSASGGAALPALPNSLIAGLSGLALAPGGPVGSLPPNAAHHYHHAQLPAPGSPSFSGAGNGKKKSIRIEEVGSAHPTASNKQPHRPKNSANHNKPSKRAGCRVFVGNLPEDFRSLALNNLVNSLVGCQGQIDGDLSFKNAAPGSSHAGKAWCIIPFRTPEAAKSAVRHLNGRRFDGMVLTAVIKNE